MSESKFSRLLSCGVKGNRSSRRGGDHFGSFIMAPFADAHSKSEFKELSYHFFDLVIRIFLNIECELLLGDDVLHLKPNCFSIRIL